MPARQTAAHETESASCKVGYRNPPRHTQFRKGQSGNPGGRPRRDEVERLKAITFQEAYRAVVIKENGIMAPVPAIQAVMRRQVELAMEGNVHAQRALLRAVGTYERADAEKAALEEYVEELARQAADLEEGVLAARRAAQTPEKKMTLIEAARRVRELLGLNRPKDNGEARDPGTAETVAEQETTEEPEEREQEDNEETERATEKTDAEWNAATPPPVDRAPQPENGTSPAAPPFVSRPAAEPPADPRPRPPRRRASHGTPEPAPSEGADAGPTSHGITCGVIRRESGGSSNPRRCGGLNLRRRGDDSGEFRAPARPAAKSAKIPDKFPVLRDSGRRSKRAARRQRGRGG